MSRSARTFDYLDVSGDNGYDVMRTPYHLVPHEIPLSVVRAVDIGEPTVCPNTDW
ncbi:hypothetical protein [Arthrobacter sp. TS-15]|uniref:hypothetical protein n=1 Tax=Arthrobacter sp. TS-15 TaxID=2510797 RepID=UPI00135B28D9|nr:hypothetical protein [Arthrobacter sp. TS-15]